MKLTGSKPQRVGWLAIAVVFGAACSGGAPATPAPAPTTTSSASAPAPAPQAAIGDVERAEFNPSLNVHLDSMVRRSSGLYVQDLVMGNGAVATRNRTVIVRYSGWLANGKQFDSGEITVTLGTNKTIRAWEDGILGMRVGGRRRLVVPPNLGYGSRGNGDVIPPNAVLVFEMEMTSAM
jgi:FKBP-type peptidyl-prolyl cis-trans isomerase